MKFGKKGKYISGSGNNEIRKDTCGARMRRGYYGKTSENEGWEIDHIKPRAEGGGDELDNLQPLQWENNRHKSDDYPDWSCKNKG